MKDDLVRNISEGDRVSVAAEVFSIYAYRELKEQLGGLEEFRFIFTSQAFTKDRPERKAREFYIPRLSRESGLYGTQLEIRLRNELTQKSIASECAQWIRKKARFKSFEVDDGLGNTFFVDDNGDDVIAYTPFSGFTTSELGAEPDVNRPSLVMRPDTVTSRCLLDLFDRAWSSGELHDVTDTVVDSITAMYRENSPELVYYVALYRIFREFLDDVSEDVLPKEGTGFKESAIWEKLYDFQRDAAIAIINKLETFNGCILADSVGLGKTFTALAVIKYYQCRNFNVLVLCPKKLKDNWITYNSNVLNNPIASDQLRYDVLFHTDLSRTRGISETGIPLDRVNWGNYDLVVIDESHNFRNGGDSATDCKLNRYQILMEKVIKRGVKTKVLMLSATPVNNRFRDLRNQLALAYQGDPHGWSERLNISSDIETVFRNAQKTYKVWTDLPPVQRTTQELISRLDPDFFEVLDQVTVARSRKHIQQYYDMSRLGPFPRRLKPISRQPDLSTLPGSITYDEIYDELDSLKLAVYIPSAYLQPSKRYKYEDSGTGNLSIAGRETGIRRLMTTNLLKRLESSVSSFLMTLKRVLELMEKNIEIVDSYKETHDPNIFVDNVSGVDLDEDDQDATETSAGSGILLEDMDWVSWQRDLLDDVASIRVLIAMVKDIDPVHDAKLLRLCQDVQHKMQRPLNPGNRKVIVFTAFSDTAAYIYEHLSDFAAKELGGMRSALVTGSLCKTNCPGVRADMTEILECFSPVSKERAALAPQLEGRDIDILVATDCISEGQNLQDCDYLINYDIHWNPVRIVQRFGRIDRIGSKNAEIQLVNYWPNVELDKYINLKERVKARTRITVMTSTGDDDYVNPEEQGDLEYRRRQLEQMHDEVVDLEDVSGGVSITDLGLNEFRMDLVAYYHDHPDLDRVPSGIEAVVDGEKPGVIFVLRNVNGAVDPADRNRIRPFYLVYVGDDGAIVHSHLDPKATLDGMRSLCKGKTEYSKELCREFNKATKNGRDMRWATGLLGDAVESIAGAKEESDVDSFFGGGTTGFLENDVQGLDDFELICFLVVRPKC
jgi:ERCC4-related helicase